MDGSGSGYSPLAGFCQLMIQSIGRFLSAHDTVHWQVSVSSGYSPLAGFCQDGYDPTRSIKSISQQTEWTISFLKRALTHAGY